MTVKTILGYEIQPGVSPEEYEAWLFDVHAPDLLANPFLDRIVFNKVLRPVRQASGGSAAVPEGLSFYRIAEMHYADEEAYQKYLDWFAEHPIPAERGPAGRTDFKFYLVTESTEVTR
jgi:EthD domain-containing protein